MLKRLCALVLTLLACHSGAQLVIDKIEAGPTYSPEGTTLFGPRVLPDSNIVVVIRSQTLDKTKLYLLDSMGNYLWNQEIPNGFKDIKWTSDCSTFYTSSNQDLSVVTAGNVTSIAYFPGPIAVDSQDRLLMARENGGSIQLFRFTDGLGNVPETQSFSGGAPTQLDVAADGFIYVASEDQIDGWDLVKAKSDFTQAPAWNQRYDDFLEGIVIDSPGRLVSSPSTIYVGVAKSYNSYDDDTVLYAINPVDGTEKHVRFNGSTDQNEEVVGLVTRPDGKVAVVSRTAYIQGFPSKYYLSFVLCDMSGEGSIVASWEKWSVAQSGSCYPTGISCDSANNVFISGYVDWVGTRGDAMLMMVDPDGRYKWEYVYNDSTSGLDVGGSAVPGPNGVIAFWIAQRPGIHQQPICMKLVSVDAKFNPATATGGNNATLTVTTSGPAPQAMQFSVTSTNGLLSLPSWVTIPAGQTTKTASVPVKTTQANVNENVWIGVAGGYTGYYPDINLNRAFLVKAPVLNTLNLSATTVQGGSNVTATVTLTGKAPTGGVTVNLYEATPYADINPTLFFAKDEMTKTVTVVTKPVSSNQTLTILATLNGAARLKTLTITRPVLNVISVPTLTFTGGTSVPLTVWLTGNSPFGYSVALSDDSIAATTPPSLTFQTGQPSAMLSIPTSPVAANTIVTFSATLNGVTKTKSITLIPPTVASLVVTPGTVFSGHPTAGIVYLNQAAPAGGLTIALSSNLPATITLPTTVFVPAGSYSASFMILTSTVISQTTATITGTLGSKTVSGDIVLLP